MPRVSASHSRAHKGCLFRPQGCWLPPRGSHQTDRWYPRGSQALGSLRQVFPLPIDSLLQNPRKQRLPRVLQLVCQDSLLPGPWMGEGLRLGRDVSSGQPHTICAMILPAWAASAPHPETRKASVHLMGTSLGKNSGPYQERRVPVAGRWEVPGVKGGSQEPLPRRR